jgi:hypothetical protein
MGTIEKVTAQQVRVTQAGRTGRYASTQRHHHWVFKIPEELFQQVAKDRGLEIE